jgi:hypothetical protein
MVRRIVLLLGVLLMSNRVRAAEAEWWQTGVFAWKTGEALVWPAERVADPCHAIKDPTVVFFGGKWHVFCTIRSKVRTHQIEYLAFEDWGKANGAKRELLKVTEGYYCAPQVFYFEPQKKWYLVYQATDKSRTPEWFGPAYSTNEDVGKVEGWTKTAFFEMKQPADKRWIDFWVICDEAKAYLFYTALNGTMWRAETNLSEFPRRWSEPVKCLQGDIFEASHTYRVKGMQKYLTLVEAQDGGRRYYKAYVAERLDGQWKELAGTSQKPFASRANVKQTGVKWTDSISHGELIRDGYDQRLEVDGRRLRFLFQGVSDEAKAGKGYGDIPWRLGILEEAEERGALGGR